MLLVLTLLEHKIREKLVSSSSVLFINGVTTYVKNVIGLLGLVRKRMQTISEVPFVRSIEPTGGVNINFGLH
jgi:hypothetical protein